MEIFDIFWKMWDEMTFPEIFLELFPYIVFIGSLAGFIGHSLMLIVGWEKWK